MAMKARSQDDGRPGLGRVAWCAAHKALPVGLGVISYGVVFGILARQAGLDVWETVFMSGAVFAGASQFVALDLWLHPLPMATIIITTLVVNLRHVLMGAALCPHIRGQSAWARYGAVFFMADENWALTMAAQKQPGPKGGAYTLAYLMGSGACLFCCWVSSGLAGRLFGGLVRDPAAWGLDFAFTAAFIALLVMFWTGKRDLIPWLAAAGLAVAGAHFLPGKWYILIGGLGGSLAGPLTKGVSREP